MLVADALVDLETPLWEGAPFTAVLLGVSDIGDVELPRAAGPVTVLSATPITATEAAWVRLKGAEAMREAWRVDGVDVLDPSAAGCSAPLDNPLCHLRFRSHLTPQLSLRVLSSTAPPNP